MDAAAPGDAEQGVEADVAAAEPEIEPGAGEARGPLGACRRRDSGEQAEQEQD
ncbi:MAG: hypothetical protein U0104_06675 [Gemmatimonadales bacterium]|nr:hypothetical protein [Gemmatimonadales bacterium]